MSSIFPIREKVSLDRDAEPRLVDLDEDTADEVFEALASTTTRKIFLELHNQPQTASDLADVTETSVQNVQYHLEKLNQVDLVEVVDTWYSERGSEMKVYAPQDESLVLFAGRDKQSAFRRLFDRFAGLFALLVPPSILAGWLANRGESGDGIRGEYATGDGTPAGAEGSGDDAFTADSADDREDGGVGAEGVDDGDGGGDDADGGGTDAGDAGGNDLPDETGTPTDAAEASPTPGTDGGTIDPTTTEFETESVEVVLDNSSEYAELTASQNETVHLVLENSGGSDVMGVDPTVAFAFFLGGLAVYGVLLLRRRVI